MLLLLAGVGQSGAALDINDRGPALRAGQFNLRVSNAGVFGNPFPERSFDPSFEYPKGSGIELMRYGALWVGALDEDGEPRVSGGPNLEWRPTPAPGDTVLESWHGEIGGLRNVDDDGDGSLDEDPKDGRDNDGDGEVDEDHGVIGQQMLVATYSDDRPEAVGYFYGGESHRALGLSVHQQASAWSYPGYDGIAGLQFRITNHGDKILRDLYVGFFTDFDVRSRQSQGGPGDDVIQRIAYDQSVARGSSAIRVYGALYSTGVASCFDRFRGTAPAIAGREGDTPLSAVSILPLEHSVDALAAFRPDVARAPRFQAFRTSVYGLSRGPGSGGPPRLDAERYAALAGTWPQSADGLRDEQLLLLSCGPFPRVMPGQTIEFALALVAAPVPESLAVFMNRAAFLFSGVRLNLMPDLTGPDAREFNNGLTGINGHEVCLEPPPGIEFEGDPDCVGKFGNDFTDAPTPRMRTYRHGECIWTDGDCDPCTGLNGFETIVRWVDPANVPPSPTYRVTALDRGVRIEWDNMPEILTAAGKAGPPLEFGTRFLGYRVYKLVDWRNRSSLLAPEDNWASIGWWGWDEGDSRLPIAAITDSTLDYERIWYERPHYPVGRYAVVDTQVFNGFDYIYVVTSTVQVQRTFQGVPVIHRYESPIAPTFDQLVRPRLEAKPDARQVWVVPNPFRGAAQWDRPQVYGDRVTRHLDFMGLPRAPCTIRIWTVAGDHVATIQHDGTSGSGQASWNLVSRNGQEVASGIYLFTVESSLGGAKGRFVVIR